MRIRGNSRNSLSARRETRGILIRGGPVLHDVKRVEEHCGLHGGRMELREIQAGSELALCSELALGWSGFRAALEQEQEQGNVLRGTCA